MHLSNQKQGEFKILMDTRENVQKWLNQWRHQYVITFHKVEFMPNNQMVHMLIERNELPPQTSINNSGELSHG